MIISCRIEIYPSRSVANLDRIRLPDIPRIFIFIILLYPFKRRKAMYRKSHRIMPVQKYSKWNITAASLGTEEMAHFEMVATIVHQLTRNLTPEEIKESGFGDYYIDHTLGIWPQAAGGVPFNACEFQVKGDPITDIVEDMAAEQKARSTYDNILRVVKDPDVIDPIRFLRAREVVHFQRFGEALRIIQEHLDSKNFYAFNPAIDKNCK